MGVEKRVLRHRFNKKGAVVSGRRAAAAPHERSPEKSSKSSPWVRVRPTKRNISRFLFLTDLTLATSRGFHHRRMLIKSSSG